MVLGRPKSFDCRLDVKITIMQNAALETLADWMGVPKAELVRQMLDIDRVLAYHRHLLGLPDDTAPLLQAGRDG